MASSDPHALVGVTIDERYKIEACLGTGTMGAVYQAQHILMKKRVALKVLHPTHTQDREVVERFQREAQAAANIEHPNICAATDFGRFDENHYFLVMEYLDGRPLVEFIKASEKFSVDRALHIGIQILSALEKAHEVGVVHRDLKPENIILVEKEGDPDFVKITDFGVAQVRLFKDAARLTQAGVVYGSPLYMSPQQASGQPIDHRADLYSVGIMLYEMLSGKLPFFAKSLMVVLNMHIVDPPPPFKKSAPELQIPAEIEAIVMRLLAKEPGERFQSAKDVRLALEKAREHANKPRSPFADILDELQSIPRPILIGATAIGLVISAILIAVILPDGEEPSDENGETVDAIEFDPTPVATAEDQRRKFLLSISSPTLEKLTDDDPEVALSKLESAVETHPESPHVHFLRGKALMNIGEESQAFGAFAKAIELDTKYGTEPGILDPTFQVFERRKASSAEPAIDLIENHLKELANNRLATLAEHHKTRRVRRRALETLRKNGQFDNLARWNQLTIELRHAEGCEDNRAIINQISNLGDPRALAALRRFSALPKNGCKGEDCFDCARSDLRVAIDRLEARQQTPEL